MNQFAKFSLVVLIAVATMLASVPAQAKSGSGPTGWQIFCLHNPQDCTGGGTKKIAATDVTMSTLKRVNASVNRSIKPRRDGKLDVWSVSVRVGDCEDYALTKRRQLIQSGIPASALRIAQVKTAKGEGHAILVVETDRGRFVLDNLTGAIKPLSQTHYRVLSIQTANPKVWI